MEIALSILVVPLLCWSVLFLVECVLALLPHARRCSVPAIAKASHNLAVLIPAHNEEQGIAATVQLVVPQLRKGDCVLVVADNCTDETASRARAAGAEVLERENLAERGKGHALAFGRAHLARSHSDVVVVVDADCSLSPRCLDTLRSHVEATGQVVQADYLMVDPDARGITALSALAVIIRNRVRPTGLRVIGVPCLLTGSGMAFPWDVFSSVDLGGGNIVEDMQIGVDVVIAGGLTTYCSDARVTSQFPSAMPDALEQRRRWEHGHLRTLLSQAPRLLAVGVRRCSPRLIWFAMHLSVPPLAALAALLACIGVASALACTWGDSMNQPLVLSLAGIAALALGTILAWIRYGRGLIAAGTLVAAPLYIAWKMPLYVAFALRKGQRVWVRTKRDND